MLIVILSSAAANALGIGAASFWSGAEKDIAESPTAIAGTPSFLKFRVNKFESLFAHDSKLKLKPQKKSVGGDDIHRLIKEGFTVLGNDFLAYIYRVGDRRTVLRHKSQIDVNSIANPIGRIRKTHALITSARRNHVVDGNTHSMCHYNNL